MTSATNPWNAIYKMASGKAKYTTHMTTMRLQDDSLTTNIQDTLLHKIKNLRQTTTKRMTPKYTVRPEI